MGLSSRREAVLQAALASAGITVERRTTLAMSRGDVVETSLWHLSTASGCRATLCLVTEVGLDSFFPPVLRAVPGHVDAAAARDAPGEELAWEDDAELPAFAKAVGTRAA
jgi:hypothetical protein